MFRGRPIRREARLKSGPPQNLGESYFFRSLFSRALSKLQTSESFPQPRTLDASRSR